MKSKSRIDKTEYSFVINEYNDLVFYKNGQSHRDKDLPASIWNNGDMFWYKNGERHRENDLPAVIWNNGYIAWYIDGEFIKEYKNEI